MTGNLLHKEYHRLRTDGRGAADAYRSAKAAAVRDVTLTLLGLPGIRNRLTALYAGESHTFEVSGVTYRVDVYADDDARHDDDDYCVEHLRYAPDHGEEGWGRTGRWDGTYLQNEGREGWRRVHLPGDLRLGELIAYNRKTMSKQVAFDKACAQQDRYRGWVERSIQGSIAYVGYRLYRIKEVAPDEDELTELDSCWGFDDDEDYMIDEYVIPNILQYVADGGRND